MSENVDKITEKVYCTGHPQDNSAMWAALMNQKDNTDPMAMAAMMNNMNNSQWDNPFIYLVWLMFAKKMWGDDGEKTQSLEIQNQLSAMRSQMQDNQNSNLVMDAIKGNAAAINQLASNLNCDFNTLNSSICDVKSGIDKVAGAVGFSSERVINAVQSGNAAVTQALQTCCCNTQTSIASLKSDLLLQNCKDTGELRNGQRDLGQIITQGFAQLGYQNQQDKCDIIQANEKNAQRIVDVLNIHWQQDLQQRYNDARLELSQLRQNAALVAQLKGTTTTTAAAA